MAGRASTSKLTGLNFLIVPLAIVFVWLLLAQNCGSANLKPDQAPVNAETSPRTEKITVKIYPDQWSEWVSLPTACFARLKAPGWHEYWFWDGRRVRINENEKKWLGDSAANSVFRLRGKEGEAIITVEYR